MYKYYFYIYIFYTLPKFELQIFWNVYTFPNIFEKKIVFLFTRNQLKDILISRIIQANIWSWNEKKTRILVINADQ